MNRDGYHNRTFFEEFLCRFPNNINHRSIDQLVAEDFCVASLFGNEYANSTCPRGYCKDERAQWNYCIECWRREIEEKNV